MLGGPVRERIRLYWAHCGTYQLSFAEEMQIKPMRSLDDVVELGRQAASSGYSALKTNVFRFDDGEASLHSPGFWQGEGYPELNADRAVIRAMCEQLDAFREGTGPDFDILVDLNFNFKTEGYLGMVHELDDLGLQWFEIDTYNPTALRDIRRSCKTPIASCESLYGRRQYRPFFEQHSVDVAIIDVPWNGIIESVKIAAMAEPYEINVAPHNFYGHLSTLMSAHFCAVLPHLRIMQIDPDDVPWKDDLVTVPPVIENGVLKLPTGPGWGADPDEDAIRAHPPKGGWRG